MFGLLLLIYMLSYTLNILTSWDTIWIFVQIKSFRWNSLLNLHSNIYMYLNLYIPVGIFHPACVCGKYGTEFLEQPTPTYSSTPSSLSNNLVCSCVNREPNPSVVFHEERSKPCHIAKKILFMQVHVYILWLTNICIKI